MDDLMTRMRRVLSYKVSLETLIEIAMWLAIPHLLIGLTWAFFHVEAVQQLEVQLDRILPAGAEVGAYVLAALLWPVLLLLPPLCIG
ncbi:hypothetical protein FHT40_002726 [Mycolicibacterium sp. BK556]|uniref:hypothetical protein n=1 Tax=Mycobacteriaceae TaxID=1762 RepID=UPI00105EBE7A|nr:MULTISPECIES: hypothetical protein [Mycobacteriaceae]MBB3603065.1 hypothetical protein [Mycolicibacterium sp. BK556]MBB3633260.1 hypothetical protein [Mycolicibacterium sp. BK607]MBB3750832.1 hypothetical protein [Mycolicibacterium sp. BK634]TDO07234.1 hypothetical protein EV580_6201 [Mycobacterium sp. BK086]